MSHASDINAQRGLLAGIARTGRPFFQQQAARLADAWARRRVYHRTRHELESLTRRNLAEMGIAPGQIPQIAKDHAYGH